jgi:hypothetical protein
VPSSGHKAKSAAKILPFNHLKKILQLKKCNSIEFDVLKIKLKLKNVLV